ncbi:MAG: Rne/Rng family ribonuclease [Candidatus Gastranaerophilales bacterium]|nr:Rne/Rng family ribonuclease [Candidatus Gastranaerophilales bacterium]
MAKSIIIAERDNVAAVMENGKVSEFFVNRGEILLNDVYLSTVDNILPSIDAAFVNVGSDKMGFLHANDAIGKGSLKDKLTPKQKLIVQVVKEPTGHKGPRVTTQISLPGRFLVLMPYETGVNVSRKIVSSKERARLKSVVGLLKPVGVGVIVRTEAENQPDADIQEDLELLLEKWNGIITAAETHEAPSLLYRDQDLLYRVMREACSEDVKEIVLDSSFAMHRTQQILQNWNMKKNIELNVYKGTEPLLVASGVAKEIKTALQTKVNLPCGGYLFIQTTEALTVVDVNSGKFISSATQDETILKTNKEAVHEIARQLRLRNIGGMIIIDFIDMNSRNDKLAIMEEMELALENDKAKPQVGQLSDLGLVELTRHRQGQALAEIFGKKCPHCGGSGLLPEDLTFSSSVAEGEYKAKAAKLKVPVQQVKNKNQAHKFNKVFNYQNPEQNTEKTEKTETSQQEQTQYRQNQNQDRPFNRNNKQRFNKNNNRRFEPKPQEALKDETQPQEVTVEAKQEVVSLDVKNEPKIDVEIKTENSPAKVEEVVETKNEKIEEVSKPETKKEAEDKKEPKTRGRKPRVTKSVKEKATTNSESESKNEQVALDVEPKKTAKPRGRKPKAAKNENPTEKVEKDEVTA